MLDGLRREIEPVSAADLLRFLFGWQHVRPGTQLHGQPGLARIIAQLQGFEAAAGAWEREILPARLAGYDSAWLDALCLSGGVTWGRLAARAAGGTPSRAAPIALVRRADLPWLLAPETEPADDAALSAPARDVLAFIGRAGASFLDEIIAGTRRLRAEVEDAMGELVSAGRITGDGFSGLRALISATQTRGGARARWHARWHRRAGRRGRRRALVAAAPAARGAARRDGAGRSRAGAGDAPRGARAPVRQTLRRRVSRPAGARDAGAAVARPGAHLPAPGDERRAARRAPGRRLRRRAVRGARRGRRAARHAARRTSRRDRHACRRADPLNLVGIITPGPRVAASHATTVTYRDGVPQPAASSNEAPPRPASPAHAAL